MEDIYLRITLHDNDFNRELGEVCEFLSLYLPDSKLLADWRWTYHNETNDILKTAIKCIWDNPEIYSLIRLKGLFNNLFRK